MDIAVSVLVGFVSGVLSSMGFGGGTVLILYFALFTSVSQVTAQGINLVYFLPVAALAIVFHAKNRIIKTRLLPVLIIFGIIGAVAGSVVSTLVMDRQLLRKLFAVCILLFGIYELFTKSEKDGGNNENLEQAEHRKRR